IRIVRVDGSRVWLDEKITVAFVSIHDVVINSLDAENGVVRWELDRTASHDIVDTRGSWRLLPLDDRRQTLLTYRRGDHTGRPVRCNFVSVRLYVRPRVGRCCDCGSHPRHDPRGVPA